MITAAIVHIKHPAIRVPLWSLWYLFALAHACALVGWRGEWHRLAAAGFWDLQFKAYIVGIDGIADDEGNTK